MMIPINVEFTTLEYRHLEAIATKRGIRAHILIEQLVRTALRPKVKQRARHIAADRVAQYDAECARIAELHAEGLNDRQIAERLRIAVDNVHYRRRVVLKLPAHRVQRKRVSKPRPPMPSPTITVYTKSDCQQCEATKRWLKQRDLTFTEINLEAEIEPGGAGTNLEAAKALGYTSAPVIFASLDGIPGNEIHWSGFRPDQLNRLEKAA